METTLNAEPERLGHWSTEISVLTGEVENLRGRVAELSAQKDRLQAHNSELVMRAQEADQKARCLHGAEERAHRAEAALRELRWRAGQVIEAWEGLGAERVADRFSNLRSRMVDLANARAER